ncbi:hypothetical protein DYB34_007092 [Aphanomyces astaci]|uniref:Uncharacterized protein n=1 Tax=Aphanomyces astaci TaxID=112090 RepID=A0A418C4C6_APHAT|nr:hypothetical protein DYB34_007092 [Aphanomyces astaci]
MKNIPTALTPSSSDAETASLTADDDTDLEHGASPSASPVGMLSLWSNIKSKSQTALSPAQLDNVKSYPQRFRSFVLLLLLAGLFFGMASLFLPLLLLRPSKFALSFSFGSISCLSAVAALRGWKSYCTSLLQAEHILLTTLYLISLGATLYSCLVMGSYLYVLVSAGVQLVTLGYFLVSAFPGGVAAFNKIHGADASRADAQEVREGRFIASFQRSCCRSRMLPPLCRENDEMKKQIISSIMTPEAKERLSRIAIVKPDKAAALEDTIIQMAQRGQLPGQIDEAKFIELLSRTGAAEDQQRTKVTIQRRTYFSDEEDADDDDDF